MVQSNDQKIILF